MHRVLDRRRQLCRTLIRLDCDSTPRPRAAGSGCSGGFLRLARAKPGNDLVGVRGAFDIADGEFKLNLYAVPRAYLESDEATRAMADAFYGSETRFSRDQLSQYAVGSLGWALKR